MLSACDIIKMLFRSFFIQAGFNLERYQNIGFVYAISSIINKHIGEKERKKNILKRHLEIFNTQPYMAGFVIGNISRMEIDGANEKEIVNIKQSLACTYASIGDRVFWSRIRAVLAYSTLLIFVIFYYSCGGNYKYYLWISAVVPTLFYVFYTIYIRYIGIKYGFECGGKRNCGLDLFNWNRIIKTLSRISFFLTSVCFVIVIFIYWFLIIKHNGFADFIYFSIPFISFGIQRVFRKDNKNIFYPISVMIAISFILAFFTL